LNECGDSILSLWYSLSDRIEEDHRTELINKDKVSNAELMDTRSIY